MKTHDERGEVYCVTWRYGIVVVAVVAVVAVVVGGGGAGCGGWRDGVASRRIAWRQFDLRIFDLYLKSDWGCRWMSDEAEQQRELRNYCWGYCWPNVDDGGFDRSAGSGGRGRQSWVTSVSGLLRVTNLIPVL